MTGELRDNPCKKCDKHDEICHSVCLYYKEWREKRDLMLQEEAKEKARDIALSDLKTTGVAKSLRSRSRMRDYRGQ